MKEAAVQLDPATSRPRIVGKYDEGGRWMLPSTCRRWAN
jgi:hypothetical protein